MGTLFGSVLYSQGVFGWRVCSDIKPSFYLVKLGHCNRPTFMFKTLVSAIYSFPLAQYGSIIHSGPKFLVRGQGHIRPVKISWSDYILPLYYILRNITYAWHCLAHTSHFKLVTLNQVHCIYVNCEGHSRYL